MDGGIETYKVIQSMVRYYTANCTLCEHQKFGMDRISGSVSGIRQNPAIFQQSGRIPDIKKPDIRQTGY